MPESLPYEFLGPYRLIRRVGKGGMGSVYVGRHVKSDEEVAIKVIAEHVADEPKFRRRFDGEVQSLQRLRHPGIVRLIGFGEQSGRLFYVMELVGGESLQSVIRRESKIEWMDTIDIAIQICAALKHAHDLGIIHRDLKPANLIVDNDGRIKLVDFGIAKIFGDRNDRTMAGAMLGTADYMAPEQAAGAGITQRTDLYALGSVMYAMLSGHPPFRGRNITAVIDALRREPPRPLSDLVPNVPDELAYLVHDLLEKLPEDRPPTALAVLNRLKANRLGLNREQTSIDEAVDPSLEGGLPQDFEFESSSPQSPSPRQSSSVVPPGASDMGEATGIDGVDLPSPTLVSRGQEATAVPIRVTGASRRITGGAPGVVSGVGSSTGSDTDDDGSADIAATHYRLADETPGEVFETHDRTGYSQTLIAATALIALIVVIGWMGYRLFRPPSADELFARAQNGERAAIDAFLIRYPDDSRGTRLRERQLAMRSRGTIKRLTTQRRLGLTPLTPPQSAFLNAIEDRDTDPVETHARLERWLVLFGRGGGDPAARRDADELAVLARFERDRLVDGNPVTTLDPRAIDLMSRIADSMRRDDPEVARQTLQGIIENFSDRDWAAPAVKEAESQLSILAELARGEPDD